MKIKTNRVSSLALVLPLAFLLSACAGANWNTGPNASTAGAPCPCCAKMAGAMGCPIDQTGHKKSCCAGCCTQNASGGMMCKTAK